MEKRRKSLVSQSTARIVNAPTGRQRSAPTIAPAKPKGAAVKSSKDKAASQKVVELEERHRARLQTTQGRTANEHLKNAQARLFAYIEESDDEELKTLYREMRYGLRLASERRSSPAKNTPAFKAI